MGNECSSQCNCTQSRERQIEYQLNQDDIMGKAQQLSLRESKDSIDFQLYDQNNNVKIQNNLHPIDLQNQEYGYFENPNNIQHHSILQDTLVQQNTIPNTQISPIKQSMKNLNNLSMSQQNINTGFNNTFNNLSNNIQFTNQTFSQINGQSRKLVKEKRPPVQLNNGAIYTGEWVGNKKEGQGIQKWPDGAEYNGSWKNGKANGEGKFIHADGDIFEGTWVDDKANGYGVFTRINGSKYCGYWKDDMQNGHGVEEWSDGSKYQGYYKDGKKHGQGTYIWADGSSYDGFWRENFLDGYGVYKWPDGRRYEGYWQSNNMHGKGKYSWKDGRFYEGEYYEDKKHGYGIYRWADGKTYEGEWMYGKQHGKGKYIYTTGEERWCLYENGKRLRWLTDEEVYLLSKYPQNYNSKNSQNNQEHINDFSPQNQLNQVPINKQIF
ncbi:hypothetical protein ABPG74_014686 [Tetrahymena malaccensis]